MLHNKSLYLVVFTSVIVLTLFSSSPARAYSSCAFNIAVAEVTLDDVKLHDADETFNITSYNQSFEHPALKIHHQYCKVGTHTPCTELRLYYNSICPSYDEDTFVIYAQGYHGWADSVFPAPKPFQEFTLYPPMYKIATIPIMELLKHDKITLPMDHPHAEYQFTFDLSIKKTNKLPPEEIKEYYQYLEKQSEKNKSETLSSSQNRTSDS
jgi:hypothetical protein